MNVATDKKQKRKNPFVGPEPINAGDPFFGRDDEIEQLTYLINSERIVLLHSPSGAGKTSIINAGLIPSLQNEEFEVLPVIRLNLLTDSDRNAENQYVASMISSIRSRLNDRVIDSTVPSAKLFTDLFEEIVLAKRFPCLIFDQFEEVITLDPIDWDKKLKFFQFLGHLLSDGRIWAIFAAREDFLPAMFDLCQELPTRWSTRFRLDFLKKEPAKRAIIDTAKTAGVLFQEDLAAELVDDLAVIEVQTMDGKFHSTVGKYVEPLHLQLVCKRICAPLFPKDDTLGDKILVVSKNKRHEAKGSVSNALRDYYREEVTAVARGNLALEREIREWFRDRLLSDLNVRVPVLLESDRTQGLSNSIIERLRDAYLVRMDQRANSIWFELSHDRLIQPIIEDNKDWFGKHPKPLETRYAEWIQSDRSSALLLHGKELSQAIKEERLQSSRFSPQEKELLSRSKEERNRTRWNLFLPISLALIMISASFLTVLFLQNNQLRINNTELDVLNKKLAKQDEEARLLSQAYKNWSLSDPDTLVLYFAHILKKFRGSQEEGAGQSTFLDPLGFALDRRGPLIGTLRLYENDRAGILRPQIQPIWTVAYSPDTLMLATGGSDRKLRIWKTGADLSQNRVPVFSTTLPGIILSLAWNADGQELAVATSSGLFVFARSGFADPSVKPFELLDESAMPLGCVSNVCWNLHGGLAAGCGRGRAYVWRTFRFGFSPAIYRVPELIRESDSEVLSLCWKPDGTLLAIGDADGRVEFWDGSILSRKVPSEQGKILTMAWSNQGKLASGGSDQTIAIWKTSETNPASIPVITPKFLAHDDQLRTLAWTTDGKLLSGAEDGKVKIWTDDKLRWTSNPRETFGGSYNAVYSLSFNPSADQVALGSEDGVVRIYQIKNEKTAYTTSGNGVIWLDLDQTTHIVSALDGDGSFYRLKSNFELLTQYKLTVPSGITSASKDPQGDQLAIVLSAQQPERILNTLDSQRLVSALQLRDFSAGDFKKQLSVDDTITAVAWRPGTDIIVYGTDHGGIFLWRSAEAYRVERIINFDSTNKRANGPITTLSWDALGRYLLAAENVDYANGASKVEVFDFVSGTPELTIQEDRDYPISCSAWNRDASLIALGFSNGEVSILNCSNQTFHSVLAHGRAVRAVSWLGYDTLITCGEDRFVRVWDKLADKLLLRRSFREHSNAVLALAVDPSGTSVWSGGSDRKINRLSSTRFTYEDLWEQGKRAVNRNMTRLEWENFDPTQKYQKTFEDLPDSE